MTDTQPLAPTDDEIDAVVQACRERGLRELDVFRAVLAKWGAQPVPASYGNVTEVLDIPDKCPYFGPSPHRDVWLAGWYAARKQGGA